MTVVIAPFSNGAIRDWPAASFSALIGLLLDELDENEMIRVVGTRSQALRANAIVQPHPATRVANDCGREPWPSVAASLRSASCVIGNNSGISHIAAYYGAPTVCVFGGSHHRREWRPIGANVVLVSRAIWCSPCHIDHCGSCRYDKACLRDIAVGEVAAAVRVVMRRANGSDEAKARRDPVPHINDGSRASQTG